jgi:hypothetical protein
LAPAALESFNTALIAPFIGREGERIYNSVPVVDRSRPLVLNYRKNNQPVDHFGAVGIHESNARPIDVDAGDDHWGTFSG